MSSFTLILAIWGAFLSTVLCILQIWDRYKNRTRIFSNYSFSDLPGDEDKIIITNLGKASLLIDHFELYMASNRFFGKKKYFEVYPEEDGPLEITIPGDSRYIFRLTDQYRINSKGPLNQNIYLCLHIVGKGLKTLRIC